jgi:hypothetical protein
MQPSCNDASPSPSVRMVYAATSSSSLASTSKKFSSDLGPRCGVPSAMSHALSNQTDSLPNRIALHDCQNAYIDPEYWGDQSRDAHFFKNLNTYLTSYINTRSNRSENHGTPTCGTEMHEWRIPMLWASESGCMKMKLY